MIPTKCPTCGERFVAYEDQPDTAPPRLTIPPPAPLPTFTIPYPPPYTPAHVVEADVVPLVPRRRWRRVLRWCGIAVAVVVVSGATWVRLTLDLEMLKAQLGVQRSNERLQDEVEELRQYLRNQHIQSL